MFLVDSHCHLDKLNYHSIHKNVAEVLDKAKEKNVKLILAVSTTLSDFGKINAIIGVRKDVLLSCGIHPCNLSESYNFSELRRLSFSSRVIALGETGLDYYHNIENKTLQQEVFREHIRIGREQNKPVIVHTRHSCKDTLIILREEKARECGGVIHCFSEDINAARIFLDFGFYISFSGLITFQHSASLKEVINYIPSDRLLIETDAPYLTPVPYRGKENQPAYVYNVAKHLASLRHVTLEQLAYVTTANFNNLFNLDSSAQFISE